MTNTDAELIQEARAMLFGAEYPEDMNDVSALLSRLVDRLATLTAEGAMGVPEGYVLVPRDPTREMWVAMGNALVGYKQRHHDAVASELWNSVLAAAPNPPDRPEQSASEPGRSSTTPTEGPPPVEAPHSVQADEHTVQRALMFLNNVAPNTTDQALAALGRLADGARR